KFKQVTLVMAGACLALSACSVKSGAEYLIAGNEYFKKGDYAHAETEYREARRLEADSSTACNNFGVVLNELGKDDEAIQILSRGAQVDPKNAIAHYVLANALTHKQRFDEAIEHARKAIEIEPTDAPGHRALAEAALAKGDLPVALDEYRYLVRLDADND